MVPGTRPGAAEALCNEEELLKTRFSKFTTAASITCLVLATQVTGIASTILPSPYNSPVINMYVHSGQASVHQTTTGTLNGTTGSATALISPLPSLELMGTPGSVGYSANGSLKYYFEYTGATGSLPIDIAYNMSFDGDGYEYVSISVLDAFSQTGGLGSFCIGNSQCLGSGSTFESTQGTFNPTINLNQVYEIDLEATAANSPGGSAVHAFADPIISIDSSYTGDLNSVSLVLSDGAGNSQVGAPEPASMALLGCGVAAIIALRRRRALSRIAQAPPSHR
jgi:hypothetical protein